jgi:hypothetical protein
MDNNGKKQTLIVSAVLGALAGLGVGYMLTKRAEEQGRPALTASEGVNLGLMILGLLRQVASLGDGRDNT